MAGERTEIKCVVWDLDNTVWSGILLEGDDVAIAADVRDTIETLDSRGILHSIASRNDPEAALTKLTEHGLADYFLYPQIGWTTKSSSIKAIAAELDIGLDTIAFVDDDPFELGEVAAELPTTMCIPAAEIAGMVDRVELTPRFVTTDSTKRRHMYKAEVRRRQVAEVMPANEFLISLGMVLSIARAERDDLERINELTVRTNQLNSTGHTYSFDELDRLRRDPDHVMLIAGLEDKFGSYGKVGFALVEKGETAWLLKSILMSCRVMSRGVGSPMLNSVARRASQAGRPLRAEFIRTDRNRFMYLTFKLAGFREVERSDNVAVLERDPSAPSADPEYVTVHTDENYA
jgi:FkbH-like protein